MGVVAQQWRLARLGNPAATVALLEAAAAAVAWGKIPVLAALAALAGRAMLW